MQPRRIIPEHFAPDGAYPGRVQVTYPAETLNRIRAHMAQRHTVCDDSIVSAIRREIAMDAVHGEEVPAVCEAEIIGAIRDFLRALDRGDYGHGALHHGGVESAYVVAFRDLLSRYSAQRQADYFEDDCRRRPAELWTDSVHRVLYGSR